jgi:hypothetical protein
MKYLSTHPFNKRTQTIFRRIGLVTFDQLIEYISKHGLEHFLKHRNLGAKTFVDIVCVIARPGYDLVYENDKFLFKKSNFKDK